MKTIYLIRHAKSGWEIEGIPDIDRPLNQRGYTDAHEMSERLKEKKIKPDLVICSPAVRTTTTALIFCRKLGYDPSKISFKEKLYHTNYRDYLKVIQEIDEKYEVAFLYGHNPLISECAQALVPSIVGEMSTCGVIAIENKKWADFKPGNGNLVFEDFPKNG
ncbi:MAG: SixA phosphatase family protein [Bacteroidia bacterium]